MEQYRWMGRRYFNISCMFRFIGIDGIVSRKPHQRNWNSKSAWRITVDNHSSLIEGFFEISVDRVFDCHTSELVADEQMAIGLCISNQPAVVGVWINRDACNSSCNCHRKFPCDKSSADESGEIVALRIEITF